MSSINHFQFFCLKRKWTYPFVPKWHISDIQAVNLLGPIMYIPWHKSRWIHARGRPHMHILFGPLTNSWLLFLLYTGAPNKWVGLRFAPRQIHSWSKYWMVRMTNVSSLGWYGLCVGLVRFNMKDKLGDNFRTPGCGIKCVSLASNRLPQEWAGWRNVQAGLNRHLPLLFCAVLSAL